MAADEVPRMWDIDDPIVASMVRRCSRIAGIQDCGFAEKQDGEPLPPNPMHNALGGYKRGIWTDCAAEWPKAEANRRRGR